MSGINGARVLVTGASGRIGVVTSARLQRAGASVTALSREENPALEADRIIVGDTRSQEDVARALEGADLVVHLAALAHRDIAPAYDVYTTNVVSTFNVLAQAGARGLPRAVVAGSINSYGLPQNIHEVTPAYFPLDTDIPTDIADWYSLSKRNDENTARMAWRHWGIDVVTLRFPHVNGADNLAAIAEELAAAPRDGMREAWSYLVTEDAARAVELSLTASTTGAHAFFLAANSTLAPYRTEDLLQRYAPGAPRLRRFVEREVPIDLTPARELIGFEAHHEIPLETLDLPDDL
ncbi:NAD-dependent epimerase/dehydratase family protein [Microbacterium kyungheense]|uniref:Nucleoside-diphosphate-sugar epimerase n=1 Tax=Microbacterium kyungheense TaxID=1263636 RepID=A0A543FJ14_9MICO|nr:NAD(P)-dependent oxidoreductase [Microbacterium kyungheense]TQM33858.1 nucleoside-diphosphate-sugar epimerase [Microbacterium kyungheense]